MKINFIFFFILFISSQLIACAPAASPVAFNGSFYMIGDNVCLRGYQNEQLAKEKKILCFNKNGDITGYRTAMTDQEVNMWKFNKQMQQFNAIMADNMLDNTLDRMVWQNQMQQLNNNLMLRNMQMMNRY